MIVILMGVTGVGKTTVGERLAADLGWPFFDADALHPPANVEKLRRGVALTDEDRAPWLAAIRDLMREHAHAGRSAVIACSALKQAYRDELAAGTGDVRFVHLTGEFALIEHRLRERAGHFMSPSLLASQFATLEAPTDALRLDVSRPPDELAAEIERALALIAPSAPRAPGSRRGPRGGGGGR